MNRLLSLLLLLLACATLGAAEQPARLLFIGNSITLHGPSEKVGWAGNWGMAASAAEKDYVHLVVDAVAKRRGSPPEFRVANVVEFERGYANYDVATKLKDLAEDHADTVILAIGENVPALKTGEAKAAFKERVVQLLMLVKGKDAAVYVRSCFWADATKDTALKEACTAVGGVFVDISTLDKDEANFASSERGIAHAGVAHHPGDRGMRAIADAIVAALEKQTK